MSQSRFTQGARVVDRDGTAIGTLADYHVDTDPPYMEVLLHATTDDRVGVPLNAIDIDASTRDRIVVRTLADELLNAPRDLAEGEVISMPLMEEEIRGNVREVEKGHVRIHRRVETVPVEVPVDVASDVVEIERVPVDQMVDVAPEVRREGETLIVPVVEEVLVVEKRLHLIEEVRVTRRQEVETRVMEDTVRREVVDVTDEFSSDDDR